MNKNINIPNALSILRLLGVPIFIYFALVTEEDGLAILVLAIAGATDYLDGKLARAWNQTSAFGALLDPAADRIYIFATLIILYVRDAISLWVLVILIFRDAVLAILTILMKMRGLKLFEVTYLGKAATFNLLYAFPFLLLAQTDGIWGSIAFVAGWSFAIWGIALYISTGISYAREGFSQMRGNRVINS